MARIVASICGNVTPSSIPLMCFFPGPPLSGNVCEMDTNIGTKPQTLKFVGTPKKAKACQEACQG